MSQGSKRDADMHSVYVRIGDDIDASRVIGKGGKNRARIEKAIRCSIRKSNDDTFFEIRGSYDNTKTVETIVKCTMVRKGDVPLKSMEVQKSCTVVRIPRDTTKMVMGKGGSHLQSIQEETETVMFLAKMVDQERRYDTSTLAIFGSRHGRRLSQLLVMGLVESIIEGTFTKPWHYEKQTFDAECDLDGDWGTTVREIHDDDEMAYIIGRNKTTRNKLMKASGCVIGRVGLLLFVSGTEQQRTYAAEYIDWLLDGRDRDVGYVGIWRPEERTDCTLVSIPDDYVAWVTGVERQTLARLEDTWGVMVHVLTEKPSPTEQTFAIFGPDRARCGAQFRLQELMDRQCPGFITDKLPEGRSHDGDFVMDYLRLESGEAAYVCGKEGIMERKLAAASNAVIKFVGDVCCIGGDIRERQRAHDYIEWLLLVHRGETVSPVANYREDVTEIMLSKEESRLITPTDLQNIGQETDTVLFFTRSSEGEHGILVCGHDAGEEYRDKGRSRAVVQVRRFLNSPADEDEHWRPRKSARLSQNHDWNDNGAWHKRNEDWNGDRDWHKGKEDWNDNGAWHKGKEDWNGNVDWHKSKEDWNDNGAWHKGEEERSQTCFSGTSSQKVARMDTSAQKVVPNPVQKDTTTEKVTPLVTKNLSQKIMSKGLGKGVSTPKVGPTLALSRPQKLTPKAVGKDATTQKVAPVGAVSSTLKINPKIASKGASTLKTNQPSVRAAAVTTATTKKLIPKVTQGEADIAESRSSGPWRVFVGGLPADCSSKQLGDLVQQICSGSGLVVDDVLDCGVKPGRGSGWLELSSHAAGEKVIEELHQREVHGWEEPLRARWTVASKPQ